MVVTGVTRSTIGSIPPRRRGVEGRTFGVRSEPTPHTDETVATAGVAPTSLLALQEVESEAEKDAEAKRHGTKVVEELTALQRGLLGGSEPDLDRLATLAKRPITTADPALAGVLHALRVRAGIELARRGRAASM